MHGLIRRRSPGAAASRLARTAPLPQLWAEEEAAEHYSSESLANRSGYSRARDETAQGRQRRWLESQEAQTYGAVEPTARSVSFVNEEDGRFDGGALMRDDGPGRQCDGGDGAAAYMHAARATAPSTARARRAEEAAAQEEDARIQERWRQHASAALPPISLPMM